MFRERTNTKTFYSNVDKEVLKILHRKMKSQERPRSRKLNVTLWDSRIFKDFKSPGLVGWFFLEKKICFIFDTLGIKTTWFCA